MRFVDYWSSGTPLTLLASALGPRVWRLLYAIAPLPTLPTWHFLLTTFVIVIPVTGSLVRLLFLLWQLRRRQVFYNRTHQLWSRTTIACSPSPSSSASSLSAAASSLARRAICAFALASIPPPDCRGHLDARPFLWPKTWLWMNSS